LRFDGCALPGRRCPELFACVGHPRLKCTQPPRLGDLLAQTPYLPCALAIVGSGCTRQLSLRRVRFAWMAFSGAIPENALSFLCPTECADTNDKAHYADAEKNTAGKQHLEKRVVAPDCPLHRDDGPLDWTDVA